MINSIDEENILKFHLVLKLRSTITILTKAQKELSKKKNIHLIILIN